MKRYFSLCVGGIKSDSDASVSVESFHEISLMLKEVVGNKSLTYSTMYIVDESPIKFPYWGKTYMVLGESKDGMKIPLGYCNFEKNKASSISWFNITLWCSILISYVVSIWALTAQHFDTAIWALNSVFLTALILRMKTASVMQKLAYLLK